MPTIRSRFGPVVGLTLAVSAGASAQSPTSLPRVEIGAVARTDHIWVEGGGSGSTAVGGAVLRVRLTPALGVEGEITRAAHTLRRSYEGDFLTYAAPGASREEILRQAVIARRDLSYSPGLGTAFAFTARGSLSPRVAIVGRTGVSIRRYEERSDMTILRVPDGIDPALPARQLPDEHRSRARGGLLFGADLPVMLSTRLTVAPELRYVYGGPARVGNKHRELGLGATVAWHF